MKAEIFPLKAKGRVLIMLVLLTYCLSLHSLSFINGCMYVFFVKRPNYHYGGIEYYYALTDCLNFLTSLPFI